MIDPKTKIAVTGALGFIGSSMVSFLNQKGCENLVLVDDFSKTEKKKNLEAKTFAEKIEREQFFDWLADNAVDAIIHLGARTDTTEFDKHIFDHLNVEYSQKIWNYCAAKQIPLIYASSAATYGAGEAGYDDDESKLETLKPLNPYGASKHEFDLWSRKAAARPRDFAGLKFFNVYGPNEYHKGRMASVIFHSFNRYQETGVAKLFKSYKPEYPDGGQMRDFVYVKDVTKVIYWMLEEMLSNNWPSDKNGIYNLGSGTARTFYDLATATGRAMDIEPKVEFIDMPEDIRNTYQYFTEAPIQKLRRAGYNEKLYSLEEGIDDYVRNYLSKGAYF